MSKVTKKVIWFVSFMSLIVLLSGCFGQTDYVYITLDKELEDSQSLILRYADGETVSPDEKTGTQITVKTDETKVIVGGHITQDGISWVPDYQFPIHIPANTYMPSLTNVNETKPEAAAAYAILDEELVLSSVNGYVEVAFQIFSSEQELLTEGKTSVFAKGSVQTEFYDNDPVFRSGWVLQGYSTYTNGGKVTFLIKLPEGETIETIKLSPVKFLSANSLQLYSGETKLYDARNELEDLELSSGELNPAFSTELISYQATVDHTVNSLTVTPVAANAGAKVTVQVNGGAAVAVTSGEASGALALNVGENTVIVTVTAEDGETTRTYTVTVTREAQPLSSIAELSGLSLSQGVLNPVFDASQGTYSATVSHTVNSLTVTPVAANAGAKVTVQVNGGAAVAVTSGEASGALALNVGENTVIVTVTAEDGETTRTYTVTVTREAQPASPGYVYVPPVVQGPVTSINGKLTLPASVAGDLSLGDNRVRLIIPAGASPRALEISMAEVLDVDGLLRDGELLASSVFELLKSSTNDFSQPVTLSFGFDPANVQNNQTVAVFYYDEINKVWVPAGESRVDGNRVSVQVNHFTKFAVLVVDLEEETPVVITPPIEPEPTSLSDIAGHWAESGIWQAVRIGFVTGYPEGTFKPGQAVTRAEFVVMLVQALQLKGEGEPLSFSDRHQIGAWAQSSIALAVEAGIVRGYEDGTFRPGAAVTRAEMAVMLANALQWSAEVPITASFVDEQTIPVWAQSAVSALRHNGVVQGDETGRFQPAAPTTRAEAVTVLLRVLGIVE